jgi:hypothetical protein
VTSAFLEAAIVGRPVLTFTLPEYRLHQEEMIHFRYLMEVEGGLLHVASGLTPHFEQLAAALALDGARDEKNRRFLGAFVRPFGLDAPATPVFVEALEQLARAGARPDPSLSSLGWLRPLVLPAAARSRTGVGRWLMNDGRTDAWDEHAEETGRAVQARLDAKAQHQRDKERRKAARRRRDRALAVGKRIKSTLRRVRHRTAVTIYRGLYLLGLWRGGVPGAGGGR